ncbi:MAG: NAD(P)/FAD-dependent oxidoreductase [Negativicutes bacterium]|nr:NAD(P)/FAD-dependent oxidoreductase [Negativicutes bacterium]
MKQVLIIGGGAGGLMAAVSAAAHGGKVVLLEKMPSVGRKLLITGKGRCNLTNIADIPEIIRNIPGNGRFLNSALRSFTNQDLIEFLRANGVETKVERGGRVFPASDKARDVVVAFERSLKELGVEVLLNCPARRLLVENGLVRGAVDKAGRRYLADAVVVATGGMSYPGTGSSGDGYIMAKQVGHTIVDIKPSLVPLEVAEDWIADLQGLSLRNVEATVYSEGKKVAADFGEMLFTHFGISGPIILSLSKYVAPLLDKQKEVIVTINLKPALTPEILDKRIQRDFEKYARKALKNALGDLLPAKMIDTVIDLSFLDPDKPVHQITKSERLRLLETITRFTLAITKTRPVSEAIVTAGGVSTKEVNPSTMESKLVASLYFAGEVLDIDGYTGGYNLQAAFSSGYVAGRHAASV